MHDRAFWYTSRVLGKCLAFGKWLERLFGRLMLTVS